MYSVYFGIVKFAEFDEDVNACAVALDLHRISNCPHHIKVVDSMLNVLVELSKVDKKDGK